METPLHTLTALPIPALPIPALPPAPPPAPQAGTTPPTVSKIPGQWPHSSVPTLNQEPCHHESQNHPSTPSAPSSGDCKKHTEEDSEGLLHPLPHPLPPLPLPHLRQVSPASLIHQEYQAPLIYQAHMLPPALQSPVASPQAISSNTSASDGAKSSK